MPTCTLHHRHCAADVPVLRTKLRELGVTDTHPVRLLLSCEHELETLPGAQSDLDLGSDDLTWRTDWSDSEDEEEGESDWDDGSDWSIEDGGEGWGGFDA